MSVIKSLSKIKKSVLLSFVSKETGLEMEYIVLRPNGKATGTKAISLDLKTFTRMERSFYLGMKNEALFTYGTSYSSSTLPKTIKEMKSYIKYNGYDVVVLAVNVE